MNVIENPLYCDFLITPNCNFSCSFCSASANNRTKKKNNQLSLNVISHTLEELEELDVLRVSFEGGEPFLRKDIFDILSIADSLDFLYYINTNGSLIDEVKAKKLSQTNVSQICLSIDGPNAEIHDRCRGFSGAYDRVKNATHLLIKNNVPVQAIITLTNNNYRYFYDTLHTIKKLGISSASVMLLASVGSAGIDQIVPFEEWANLLLKLSIDKQEERLPIELRIVSTGESNYPWEIYQALLLKGHPELISQWIREDTIEPRARSRTFFELLERSD